MLSSEINFFLSTAAFRLVSGGSGTVHLNISPGRCKRGTCICDRLRHQGNLEYVGRGRPSSGCRRDLSTCEEFNFIRTGLFASVICITSARHAKGRPSPPPPGRDKYPIKN